MEYMIFLSSSVSVSQEKLLKIINVYLVWEDIIRLHQKSQHAKPAYQMRSSAQEVLRWHCSMEHGEVLKDLQKYLIVWMMKHACKFKYFIIFYRGGKNSTCSVAYKGVLCSKCSGAVKINNTEVIFARSTGTRCS
jgi:hypothetical protein